jgi:hypothetical protein
MPMQNEDFEKGYADVIKKIRSVGQEELSPGFDDVLQKEINKRSGLIFQRSATQSRMKLLKYMTWFPKKKRPVIYFSYAVGLLLVCCAGYIFIIKDSLSVKPKYMQKSGTAEVREKTETIMPGKVQLCPGKKVNPIRHSADKYQKELYKKVLENLNYGFAYNPSLGDIKKIIDSKEFTNKMSGFDKPLQEDSVRIIIEILQEKF